MSTAGEVTKVAVCQMRCGPHVAENMRRGAELVEAAAANGAKAVFLPECCDYVADSRAEAVRLAQRIDTGHVVAEYRRLAALHNVWLSLGGLHERVEGDGDKVCNAHVLLAPDGGIKAVYRKLHRFDVHLPEEKVNVNESDYTLAGDTVLAPVATDFGNVGLSTCYDVRFAEPSLQQRSLGAHVLLYPSAFTAATGAAGHWETLLRARAIECQCYVLAAAQVGCHGDGGKRRSWGHAMVVDPWGEVLCDCGEEPWSIGYADIDLGKVRSVRAELPCHQHRRPDVYHIAAGPSPVPIADGETVSFGALRLPASQVFYKTMHTLALVNIKPVLPGHVLVIPRRLCADLDQLPPPDSCDLFACVQRVVAALKRHYDTDSCTVAVQDGPAAGRSVHHVHVHVLPRRAGDFGNNDAVYSHLAIEDSARPSRTEAQMADEAELFRKWFY